MPKSGIIKDPQIHIDVIINIKDFCNSIDLHLTQLTYSPVKGATGNVEYLAYITNTKSERSLTDEEIKKIVEKTHQELN